MTLEEIEHQIMVNNNMIASYHVHINRVVGKHFVNINELHDKIHNYQKENKKLEQTKKRLEKVNHLLNNNQ